MVLTVNIGNSHLLLGVWHEHHLLFRSTISTNSTRSADEYAIQIHSVLSLHQILPEQITGGILGSVVPALTSRIREALQQVCPVRFFTVGPGLKSGLSIRIDDPAQLGAELVCAAVAALEKHQPPLIVIAIDTAVSMMAINEQRQMLGGAIFPGPALSLGALIEKSAQLSQIDLEHSPTSVIGTNTVACMQSGSIFGTACMLDGMLARFRQELGTNAEVVMTGKIPFSILQACQTPIEYDRDLILRGLYRIYQKNSR